MKNSKLTFWLLGFSCGIILSGIIGALLCINIKEYKNEVYSASEAIPSVTADNRVATTQNVISNIGIEDSKGTDAENDNKDVGKNTSTEEEIEPDDKHQEVTASSNNEVLQEKVKEDSEEPIKTTNDEKRIVIPENSGASEICILLEEEGIIEDSTKFLQYIREQKVQRFLENGEVDLPINGSYEQLLEKLCVKNLNE